MSFLKNITSKDLLLSQNTIKNLIDTINIEQFRELCEKSEFIFPFLKDRIIKDFVKLINKNNVSVVFEFSKIYCNDFEDLIVNSWLKFASQDLTDEILELFENGTIEQKTYAAKYFCYIKDSLALEYLNRYAFSEFEALKINCAKALSAFGDLEKINEAKKIVQESSDDFEAMNAYSFINAYGGKDNIKFILDNCFKSVLCSNIISNLFDFNDFYEIKNCCNDETLTRILSVLIEGYPEYISLDTILYYDIYNFIKIVYNFKTSYANNVLLITKAKFIEFSENDIYSYDLDKNTKEELKKITSYLKLLDLEFNKVEPELSENNSFRYSLALDVVKEYKIVDCADIIAKKLNEGALQEVLIAKSAIVLKELGFSRFIDKKIVDEIKDSNIRAIVENAVGI